MSEDLITEALFKPTVTTFVDKVGEVYSVPSTRFRSLSDLKNYSDAEVNIEPTMTDTTGYIPLSEDINRFFRQQDVQYDIKDEDFEEDFEADGNFGGDILDNVVENAQNQPSDVVNDYQTTSIAKEAETTVQSEEKSPAIERTAPPKASELE